MGFWIYIIVCQILRTSFMKGEIHREARYAGAEKENPVENEYP